MGGLDKWIFPRNKATDPLGIFGDPNKKGGSWGGFLENIATATADAATPAIDDPLPTMPTKTDTTVKAVERKANARQRLRRGRQSTILTALNTGPEGKLGG